MQRVSNLLVLTTFFSNTVEKLCTFKILLSYLRGIFLKYCVIFSVITALNSCAGGAGGDVYNDPNHDAVPSDWSTISSSEADVYKTTEYNANWGLAKINAAEAYAELAKNYKTVAGNGVKIAVLDTGVQTDHVEIASNYYAAESYNYVAGSSDPADGHGHGTHVSSTAAGVKDASGMHGVAYDAEIIAMKVLSDSGSGDWADTVSAISDLDLTSAKIANLSLGGSVTSGIYTDLYNAFLQAKAADVLSTISTGNDSADQPGYPAYHATEAELAGYIIAVGAVDSSSDIAYFSNNCGDTMNYCLVAPGVSIYAAVNGSTYDTYDGTSMAAPHVAGAAAVLRGAWPSLTAVQTTQILLQTATDLGDAGVDTVYGHGLLNLYAAVQAQGQNLLSAGSTVSSVGMEVSTSSLMSSSIFGDAMFSSVAPQLEKAVFFDDFGRDYRANLSSKMRSSIVSNTIQLEHHAFNNRTIKTAPLQFGDDFRLNLVYTDFKDPEAKNMYGSKHVIVDKSQDQQEFLEQGFYLAGNAIKSLPNLNLGFSSNVDIISNQNTNSFIRKASLLQHNFSSNPYQSFTVEDLSGEVNTRHFQQIFANHSFMEKKLNLNFSYQSSYSGKNILSTSTKQNQITDSTISFSPKEQQNFSLSVGQLDEFDNNFLNSKNVGVFSSNGSVQTSYLKISTDNQLSDNISLLASFSEGMTKADGNNIGVFRKFHDIRSRSMSFALIHNDFMKGKLGFSYSEPMRVYKGKVDIDIPVSRDIAGNLTRYQTTASLVPNGRERDLEIFYVKNFDDSSKLQLNLIRQYQAGNIKSSPTDYIGFLQYSFAR